jgi:hypothetical protein
MGITAMAKPNSTLSWLARRHSFPVEVLLLVLTYVTYDAGRGLVRGGASVAVVHARSIANLEQHLGLLHEVDVQRAIIHLPGVAALFDFGYDFLHLSVTGGVLLWLYVRHRDAYPRVRTTLLAATCLALVGFTLFPSAPPRLAGIGIADTLSLASDTAHSGVLQFLYNPYAAMPSLHMAYAAIAGACLYQWGRHRWVRCIGVAYPLFVAVEVVATGNHFFLDLVAGVAIDACAFAIVSHLFAERPPLRITLGTVASRGVSVLSSFREDFRRWADERSRVASGVAGFADQPTEELPDRLQRLAQFAEMIRDTGDVPQGSSTSCT